MSAGITKGYTMQIFIRLIQAITSLIVIYLLALRLRKSKVLKEEHSLILARIVTDLSLPAIVFSNLAGKQITSNDLIPALVMFIVEMCCIILSWLLCALLKMPRDTTGPIVFCSAFGSSTFLGYAVIIEMYPTVSQAMTEAVLISEIGVGYPIFILGPILAAYFGSKKTNFKDNITVSLAFFRSPLFFAIFVGILWTPLGLPTADNNLFKPLFDICDILGHALTPLAIISAGLMFKIPNIKQISLALIIVIFIKLLLKPVLLGFCADALGFEKLWKDILIILGAMPPAVLGAVFLRRYGGNASLASTILLIATCVSCITILGVFFFVG